MLLLLIIKLLLITRIYTTSPKGALCAGGTTESWVLSSVVNLQPEGTLAVRALEVKGDSGWEGPQWWNLKSYTLVMKILIKTRETWCGRRSLFDLWWFIAWGSFGKTQVYRKFKFEFNQNVNEIFVMGIFVYNEAGGVTLFLRHCIYMYTHISIYIHIHKSLHTVWGSSC